MFRALVARSAFSSSLLETSEEFPANPAALHITSRKKKITDSVMGFRDVLRVLDGAESGREDISRAL